MISDLREKIIQSALLQFEEKGFHGVSVNEIVQSVGTSKGGFYHHFSAKDELLFVIHDIFISYVLEKATIAYQTYESPTKRLQRSEEHTSELQSRGHIVCRLLLEKKNSKIYLPNN